MQDAPVLQDGLDFAPWMEARTARLPGIVPMTGDWLERDEAFAGQMAERDRLIAAGPDRVIGVVPEGRDAVAELHAAVLAKLAADGGYEVGREHVRRPDGVRVALAAAEPLAVLGRLVQQDLCVMLGSGLGHVLVGAALCFPASWTLAQKLGQPLVGIHRPVVSYDNGMARRVQRLFDAVRVGQPLMRFNALVYDDATLHQPRPEGVERPRPVERRYLRSERQCLVRLPVTGAVVFAIHTRIVRMEALTAEERAGLAAAGI